MKPLSLAIGTRVKFKSDPTGSVKVVTDLSIRDNHIEYGVGGSAWHARDEIVFISEADAQSMQEVFTHYGEVENEELE